MTTVLIVEDEEHLRTTLAYNLRKTRFQNSDFRLTLLVPPSGGCAALARLKAALPDRSNCKVPTNLI